MQFVINDPEVPDSLLESHQEGKVVFFCGAGISYPAGLPDFEKLTNQLFKQLGQQQSEQQKKAYKEKRFDTALYLLQNDLIAGRDTVRKALSGLLTPKTPTPQNTATHKALLTLAKTASGATRLVTTNFDRLFEHAIEAEKLTVQRH